MDPYRAGAGQAMLVSPSSTPTSHLLEIEYTGNLNIEIVETWYRCATIVFDVCGSIPAFLRHDSCGMGLQPFRNVNRVELELKRNNLDRNDIKENMTRASNLAKDLKVLCVLQEGATVDIIIDAARPKAFVTLAMWVGPQAPHNQAPLSKTFPEGLDVVVSEMHWQQRHSRRRLRVSVEKGPGSREMQQYLLGKDLGDIRVL
jgi:hypothetical protein